MQRMAKDSKEIEYTITNDFMTENPDTCTSVVNPNRVKKSHWKGMNEDQKKKILDEMQEQVEDKKKKKQLEKETEALWAAQEEAKRQELIRQNLEKQLREREMTQALKETHAAQKVEKSSKWANNYGEKLPLQKPAA